MRRRRVPVFLLAAAVAVGCTSFDRLQSNDPNVGEEEVFAAGGSGDPELLTHLHHVLDNHATYEPEVVAAALESVAEIGDPSSVEHVAALSDDADEEVRWHVAASLRRLGGTYADQVLARMAAGDPSDLVRSEAAQ